MKKFLLLVVLFRVEIKYNPVIKIVLIYLVEKFLDWFLKKMPRSYSKFLFEVKKYGDYEFED